MSADNLHAASLAAPVLHTQPGPAYGPRHRQWQGIPGVERTSGGRLYATWYSGGDIEGPDNHVLLVRSDDDGLTWSEPLLVVDPPGLVRAFDPVVWCDPLGRLWLFWSQCFCQRLPQWRTWNGLGGVWFIRCDRPDADIPAWTAPTRIADGVMMNKPLLRDNGEWLLPVSGWGNIEPRLPELQPEALSNVYVSSDEGRTFSRRGGADVPFRTFDEHMVVERRDGSLWMLVRTQYGIGQSTSSNGGVTWTPGMPAAIAGPGSRFHLRRLPGPHGRLLLINHRHFTGRSHLTASLSDDDGLTWSSHLLLDERADVSYPDATLTPDGRILAIYDRERHNAKEILLAAFTEADVLAGSAVTEGSFLKRIVSKAGA